MSIDQAAMREALEAAKLWLSCSDGVAINVALLNESGRREGGVTWT